MLLRGLHTPGRSLLRVAKWVILSGLALIIFIFLRKRIILTASDNIYDYARLNGFDTQTARYVVAQSGHETAGWTSSIYLKNNNAFGMKYAGQINAAGQKNGYANYSTVRMSVQDLGIWVHRRAFLIPFVSLTHYVHFLKMNRYFEDSEANYLKGCENWYNKLYNG